MPSSAMRMITKLTPRSTDELFKSAAYLTDCYLPDVPTVASTTSPKTSGEYAKEQEMPIKRSSKESTRRQAGVGKPSAKLGVMSHAGLADLALGRTSISSSSVLSQVDDSSPARKSDPYPREEDSGPTGRQQKVAFGKHLMHAPFNLAFRTDAPYFQWLETSENQARFKRFGKAMTGTSAWEVPGAIVGGMSFLQDERITCLLDLADLLVGFPWHSLPQDSVVVDVGGGIGSTSLLLAHAFPHLRFLVQDRPQVATMGEAVRHRLLVPVTKAHSPSRPGEIGVLSSWRPAARHFKGTTSSVLNRHGHSRCGIYPEGPLARTYQPFSCFV